MSSPGKRTGGFDDTPCGASQALRGLPQLPRRRDILRRLRNGHRNRVALQLEHVFRRKVASGRRVSCRSGPQSRHRSVGSVMGHECFHDLLAQMLLPPRTAGLKVRAGVSGVSRVAHQRKACGCATPSQLEREHQIRQLRLAIRGPGSVGSFPLQIAKVDFLQPHIGRAARNGGDFWRRRPHERRHQ
jgi:hypothetical protein